MITKSTMHFLSYHMALSLFAISAFMVASDYIRFHQLADSGSDVWYSTSWLTAPVTNFILVGRDTKEFWKTNATGSEQWLVREVRYEGTTFWTDLRRELVPNK